MAFPTGPAALIIAAAPGDGRAGALAGELRAGGWPAVLAITPEAGAHTSGQTCVAVLSPATWNHPAIVAAVTSRPARLIPVLADPMMLPQGPWTSAPLALAPDTGRQLLAMLGTPPGPPVMPQPTSGFVPPGVSFATGVPPSAPYTGVQPPPMRPTPTFSTGATQRTRSTRSFRGSPWYVVAVLVVAAIGVITRLGGNNSSGGSGTLQSYSAAVPGPSCDKGSGFWQIPSGESSNVTTTCQPAGMLLTRTGDSSHVAQVGFNVPNQSFPSSYDVKVTGTIVSGDSEAGVGLAVHQPVGTATGGQDFVARANGEWQALSEVSQGQPPLLNLGFLPKGLKTYTLDIQVHGAVLALSIDGAQVGTVTDTSSTSTDFISLVLSDPGNNSTVSEEFSQFAFTALSDSTLSDTDAVATATATAQAQTTFSTPYKATVPGQGCDTGGGKWANPAVFGLGASAACTKSGLQLTVSNSAGAISEEEFYLLTGSFPQNYAVQVTASLNKSSGGCAHIFTRETDQGAAYSFEVCADGSWSLDAYSSSNATNLAHGSVAAKSSHIISATSNGSTQVLKIDGHQVASQSDSTLTTTDSIGLGIDVPQGASGSVTFSDFIFTPLP